MVKIKILYWIIKPRSLAIQIPIDRIISEQQIILIDRIISEQQIILIDRIISEQQIILIDRIISEQQIILIDRIISEQQIILIDRIISELRKNGINENVIWLCNKFTLTICCTRKSHPLSNKINLINDLEK